MILYDIKIPGGSDTHYQYNNGGIFGGNAAAVFNDGTGVSTFTGATVTNCAVLGSDSAVFQPNADAVDFFQVKDAAGNPVLSIDTVNKRVGKGIADPSRGFEITGDGASGDLKVYRTGGTTGFFSIGSGSMNYESGMFKFTNNIIIRNVSNPSLLLNNTVVEVTAIGLATGVGSFSDIAVVNDIILRSFTSGNVIVAAKTAAGEIKFSTGSTDTLKAIITSGGFFGLGGEPAPETLLELTHAQPYITTQCSTHIDNLGRISKWIAKGNKLDETKHTLGIMEFGHDGTGNDTKGYFRVGTNANGGVDTIVYPFKIDSAQITHIGDGTNEVQIAADGYQTMIGDARVTRELEINAASISAGASGVTLDVARVPYIGFEFDIGDHMYTKFETPEDWDESTDIVVKIYWYINEARDGDNQEVQWSIDWKACPPNGEESVAAPADTGNIDFGDQLIPAGALALIRTGGGVIPFASLSHGDVIGLDITRVVLDGGNNPTADPAMTRIEIEYTADNLGEHL